MNPPPPLPGRNYWPAITIALAVVVVFAPALFSGFTSWDDYHWVARNWRLLPPTWASLRDDWARPFMDLYVPVAQTAWWLLAAVAGRGDAAKPLPAWVFHLASVLVHAGNAILVYALLRRWTAVTRPAAVVATLVFALHPLQVEAVAWASGLKDLLFAFFSLLALYCYTNRGGWRYAAATLAFVLALLSKPTAVVVPGIALVADRFLLDRPLRQSLIRLLPWVVLAVPCVLWTHAAQPAHRTVAPPIWERPLVAGDAVAFYLAKLVVPIDLAIDYGRTPSVVRTSGALYYTWLLPLAVLGMISLAKRAARRRYGAAIVVFLLPLLPVLGFIPFDFQAISTVADHYLYLPLLGVAVAVALAVDRHRRWLPGAAILLSLLGLLSARQCLHWRDNVALFEHALAVNPRSWAAHDSLAAAALEAGNDPAAERQARASLAINPADTAAMVHLADALARTGRQPEALRLLRDAVRRDPQSAPAAIELGSLLAQLNDPSAEAALRRAMAMAPDHPAPPLNLGTLLLSQGHAAEALLYLERAVRLAPRDPRAHTNCAIALAAVGRADEASAQLHRALRLDPHFEPARQALATLSAGSEEGRRSP